jgi:hypothetical protein
MYVYIYICIYICIGELKRVEEEGERMERQLQDARHDMQAASEVLTLLALRVHKSTGTDR